MTSQLTEREAALYNRALHDAVDALVDELETAGSEVPGEDPRAGTWADAIDHLKSTQARMARIVGPADELPPAPCGIGSTYDGAPILCGYPAGHLVDLTRDDATLSGAASPRYSDFHHAWDVLPAWPPTPADLEPDDDPVALLISELVAELAGRFVRTTWADLTYDVVARIRARFADRDT